MKRRIFKALSKFFIAACLLWVAMNIPSYLLSVETCVLESFEDSQNKESLAFLYVSTAKLDSAELILDSSDIDKEKSSAFRVNIEQIKKSKPLWGFSGAKNAFFDENEALLAPKDMKAQSAYEYLSVSANRSKALEALSKSEMPLVADILALRNLNTVLLPPAFSSAGAPYSAAIIINAILVQNSSLNSSMLRDLSHKISLLKADDDIQKEFENYCMGLLFFAKNMQFGALTETLSKLNSLEELSGLAKIFAAKTDSFKELSSAFLLYPNVAQGINYLDEAPKYEAYLEASEYSQGAMEKLLSENLKIYETPSYLEAIPRPLNALFAPLSAHHSSLALFLKFALIFLASYLLLSINIWRSDTPSWYSPLALIRGSLGAIVLASLIYLALEPSIFDLKLSEEAPQEFKLNLQIFNNLIGENDIMKFNMDTATILTLSLFLLMQFVIFATCLIKIASIKRMALSPSVKLDLLSNEDNLFDLGLYVGLGGTVLSLIMLSLNMMNTALMAGYSSTLFGIMFTAFLKIAFVRPYRHRLLLEASRHS